MAFILKIVARLAKECSTIEARIMEASSEIERLKEINVEVEDAWLANSNTALEKLDNIFNYSTEISF